MYGIPGDGYQPGNGNQYAYGDDLVGRIESAEYNLAVERGDQRQAANVLGRMIGFALNRWFSR